MVQRTNWPSIVQRYPAGAFPRMRKFDTSKCCNPREDIMEGSPWSTRTDAWTTARDCGSEEFLDVSESFPWRLAVPTLLRRSRLLVLSQSLSCGPSPATSPCLGILTFTVHALPQPRATAKTVPSTDPVCRGTRPFLRTVLTMPSKLGNTFQRQSSMLRVPWMRVSRQYCSCWQ